jgi:hypothetical protein
MIAAMNNEKEDRGHDRAAVISKLVERMSGRAVLDSPT